MVAFDALIILSVEIVSSSSLHIHNQYISFSQFNRHNTPSRDTFRIIESYLLPHQVHLYYIPHSYLCVTTHIIYTILPSDYFCCFSVTVIVFLMVS
nr:MAG TPA: hypothetical protein [Caudoviricetes sp.]